MPPPNGPVIQIAGALDLADARAVADAGATWLGLPLGPGVRTPDLSVPQCAALVAALPPGLTPVVITYLRDAASIHRLMRDAGVGAVQLHAAIELDEVRRLRDLLPDGLIVKSVIVGAAPPDALLADADALASSVDAFITDTFDPVTGASGATGRTHDWTVSRRLVDAVETPVILAGGLTPANVARAIHDVRPAGVDAHTGVEARDGRKSPDLLRAFVHAARAAFAEARGAG